MKEETTKKRMYYYELMFRSRVLRRESADTIYGDCVFLKATSKKAIKEAGVEKIDSYCTGATPITNIKLGQKYLFKAGDPIIFTGTPTEIIEIDEERYLKILVGKKGEVEVYSLIDLCKDCPYLEIIKEIKE
jgi:hypothetical protein